MKTSIWVESRRMPWAGERDVLKKVASFGHIKSRHCDMKSIARAAVEMLESRRLLSASAVLTNAPEGLELPNGGWLYVNAGGGVSETKADGSIDLSFGKDGSAAVEGVTFSGSGMNTPVNPFALTKDGEILVAGGESGENVVARFHLDGTIDSTFGDNGLAALPLGSGFSGFFALAIQDDGKIVAAGASSFLNSNNTLIWQLAVARFNADGSSDTSFNGNGVISMALPGTKGFGIGDLADAVAIAKDGKIIVGGTSASTIGPTNPVLGFGLIRLNTDGTLDTSFGDGGKIITYFKNAEQGSISTDRAEMRSLFIRDDGTILAVGSGQDLQVVAAVYNADGSLDTHWGIGGRLLVYATSGDAEHTQLTEGGGFKVFEKNDDLLFLTIGLDGKSPNPNPVDPTPGTNDSIPAPTPDPTPVPITPKLPDGPMPIDGPVWLPVWSAGPVNIDPPGNAASIAEILRHTHLFTAHRIDLGPDSPEASVAAKLVGPKVLFDASNGVSVEVNWGSSTDSVPLTPVAGDSHMRRIEARHAFSAGVYDVHLDLFIGGIVQKTIIITVHNRGTNASGLVLNAKAGKEFTMPLGWLIFENGSSPAGGLYPIGWGDGDTAVANATPVKRGGNRYALIGSHVYEKPGRYSIGVLSIADPGRGGLVNEIALSLFNSVVLVK